MSRLESFKEIKGWNLDTDRQLLEAITASTDKTYNGIKGMLELLRDLEHKTDDCYIQLKHAVNWVNTLSYTKFIENNIQPIKSASESQVVPASVPSGPKTSEQTLEKYRKAVEIALGDLNLKDVKADEGISQIEGETLEGQTIAAGGNYVTPELKGRIPFLIGSKEFSLSPYMGLEVGAISSLTEDKLKDLKEEVKGERLYDRTGENIQKAAAAMADAVEEVRSREAPTDQKKFNASNYLDPFSSTGNKPFGLEGIDEDEVLPPFNRKDQEPIAPPNIDIPMPPALDVPLPPDIDVPMPPPEEVKNAGIESQSANSVLFVDKEAEQDFSSIRARVSTVEAPKVDLKQKMSKLFGAEDDSDDEEKKVRESPQALINMYQSKNTSLFVSSEPVQARETLKPQTKPEITETSMKPERKTEVAKKFSMFLAEDDDDDFIGANTKKSGTGSSLFNND